MKMKYVRPETMSFVVEMEAGFCVGSQTEIKVEDSTIEVEEYDSFENEVTFD